MWVPQTLASPSWPHLTASQQESRLPIRVRKAEHHPSALRQASSKPFPEHTSLSKFAKEVLQMQPRQSHHGQDQELHSLTAHASHRRASRFIPLLQEPLSSYFQVKSDVLGPQRATKINRHLMILRTISYRASSQGEVWTSSSSSNTGENPSLEIRAFSCPLAKRDEIPVVSASAKLPLMLSPSHD